MNKTITVTLPPELAEWITGVSRKTGLPAESIIRQQLEKARGEENSQRILLNAG